MSKRVLTPSFVLVACPGSVEIPRFVLHWVSGFTRPKIQRTALAPDPGHTDETPDWSTRPKSPGAHWEPDALPFIRICWPTVGVNGNCLSRFPAGSLGLQIIKGVASQIWLR